MRSYVEGKFDTATLQKSDGYWQIRSIENTNFLFTRSPKNPVFSAFAPGGSYGSFYLGYLSKLQKNNVFPDIIVGSSAGALYPTLFALWTMAHRENPKKAKELFPTELSIIPENLENKSMLWNGNELINGFAQSAARLISIINERREQNTKLPDISEIRFTDLSTPI